MAAELAQDRSVRALQVAREVQNDMPKAPLGYVLEGDVLVAAKKYAQAAALYEKAYTMRKSGLVAIKLYDAWVEAGKPEQGEARIKGWLAEQPGDIATRRHLAYSRMQRGKYALAIEQYRLVLERQPKDAVALNNVAWAMNKLKDPAALRYAQQAHELSPADGGIADTLAQIMMEKGDVARRARGTAKSGRRGAVEQGNPLPSRPGAGEIGRQAEGDQSTGDRHRIGAGISAGSRSLGAAEATPAVATAFGRLATRAGPRLASDILRWSVYGRHSRASCRKIFHFRRKARGGPDWNHRHRQVAGRPKIRNATSGSAWRPDFGWTRPDVRAGLLRFRDGLVVEVADSRVG